MTIRRHLQGAVLLLAAALACTACDGSRGEAEIWRFAIEETIGSVQWSYAKEFEARIEAATAASQRPVDVQVYPYGTLGTSDHVTELLRMGTVHFATASPGHVGKLIPEAQVLLLHFVFSDDAEVNREALLDGELRRLFSDLYREKGFRLLAIFQEGWQVWTTRRAVSSPEDFDGLRMRVMTSPLLLDAYRAYGASPTPLPYGEVYSALQLRMIDGQVNPIFAIEEMSFYEVTDHLTFANHLPFVTTVATNDVFFAGLDADRRSLVSRVIDDLQQHVFEVQTRDNRERLDSMLERKPELQVSRLDAAQRQAFRERSLAVRRRFVERVGPRGEIVLEALLDAIDRAEQRARDAEADPGAPISGSVGPGASRQPDP
ncbi:MAG: C4-dicarboxylate ABC transporter [Acidobacteria bacterium]|nr:MAG: C4-dicarboxylate ABC transporter [Acidobacteriota bacterium]REK11528.1 MAG: C4-dicarboxylate ABC transporter [Acidobacteriota bacterium]